MLVVPSQTGRQECSNHGSQEEGGDEEKIKKKRKRDRRVPADQRSNSVKNKAGKITDKGKSSINLEKNLPP